MRLGVSKGGLLTFASDRGIINDSEMVTLSLLAEKTFYLPKFFFELYDDFLDLQIAFALIFYKILVLLCSGITK